MKILFITHKFPPSIGGMEKQNYELVNGVSKTNEVVLISYDSSKESKIIFFIKLRTRVKNILADHGNIDIIHLNDGLMVALTMWLKYLTNIPVVATIHGLDIVFPFKLYQKYVIPKFSYLSKLIAVSHATAEELYKRGFDQEKVVVIKNGVDVSAPLKVVKKQSRKVVGSKFSIDLKDKKIILAVGRPVRRKGFFWLAKHVLPQLPKDFVLLIAGSFYSKKTFLDRYLEYLPEKLRAVVTLFLGYPDDKGRLENLKKMTDSEQLLLLPRLTDNEMDHLYNCADVFVMPNLKVKGDMEGFGLVLLEANMKSLPVLASNIEGIRDAVIEGKTGMFLQSNDTDSWIEGITEMIEGDTILRLSKKCRFHASQNYSWDLMCKVYLTTFNDVVDYKNLSSPRLSTYSIKLNADLPLASSIK